MDAAGQRRRGWRRWVVQAGLPVCAGVVIAMGASMFVPIGGRPGVILQPGDSPHAWRLGMARGVAWYRRESPPLFRGQQLMWEPTLLGDDPFGPWHRDLPWWKVTGSKRDVPAKVVEWSVPVWPVGIAALALGAWRLQKVLVAERRRRGGLCTACGYPLNGGPACAECGVRAQG